MANNSSTESSVVRQNKKVYRIEFIRYYGIHFIFFLLLAHYFIVLINIICYTHRRTSLHNFFVFCFNVYRRFVYLHIHTRHIGIIAAKLLTKGYVN